jgi:hypothetical protein
MEIDSNTILYFGYASNLDEDTCSGRTSKPFHVLGCAHLPGYGFRFNFPNADGSARANIIKSNNETVYGVLYKLSEEDKEYFIASEPGYAFLEKDVVYKQAKVKAFTFIASASVMGIFPDKDYLNVILKGARKNKLPDAYIAMLINRSGPVLF